MNARNLGIEWIDGTLPQWQTDLTAWLHHAVATDGQP